MKSDSLWQSLWLCVCEGSNLVGEPSIFSIYCLPVDCGLQLFPPQTKASRLRAMEKDYHLECFKSVVKILKFGSNWPNWPTAGQIDAKPAPTARWWCWCKQSEQIKRHGTTNTKLDDVCISNQTSWQTWCWKVLWLLSGAEAGCEGKGVLADQVQAFLLQVILKDGIMRMVNWIICSSRTRYSAKTEGGPDMGSWHADSFGLIFFWTYCTFLPHHTSLLPQVLHKKANCSRELKCISSVAHFRPLTFSTRQGRSVI